MIAAAVECNEQLVQRPLFPAFVQGQRAIREDPDDREIDGNLRFVEADGDGGAPGRRHPVQQRHILALCPSQHHVGVLQEQIAGLPAKPGVQGAKAVAARPKIQLERPIAKRLDLRTPARWQCLRVGLNVGVAVLGERAAGGKQQPLVLGRGLENGFVELERKGKRVADEMHVLVAREGGADLRQRTGDGVDRHLLQRAASAAGRADRDQQGNEETHRPQCIPRNSGVTLKSPDSAGLRAQAQGPRAGQGIGIEESVE